MSGRRTIWLTQFLVAFWGQRNCDWTLDSSSQRSYSPSYFMYRMHLARAPGSSGAASQEGADGSRLPLPRPGGAKKPCSSTFHDNTIRSSPFRPHILAQDRLLEWRTPHGVASVQTLSRMVPVATISRWHEVLAASVEPATRRNYGAGLLRFMQFCGRYGVAEELRVPASESLLALFVAEEGAGHVAGGTIASWLSGLQMWHSVNSATWAGGRILKRTQAGAGKLAPALSTRPRRNPIMIHHLRTLREGLDLTNTRDSAVWAVACTAWRDCCRLGELVPPSQSDFEPARHVSRGCSVVRGTAGNGRQYIQFKLPWTKTRRQEGDWIVSTETRDDVDCVAALEHHLAVSPGVPSAAPLFAFETHSGHAILSRDSFGTRDPFSSRLHGPVQ
jgi:hypothetical protein